MKTERRHDLETNSLASKLNEWIETLKPHLSLIFVAIAVILAISAFGSMLTSSSSAKEQAAWDAYAQAQSAPDPEKQSLQELATSEDYIGTKMQEWAQLTWADHQLLLSSRSFLFDREASLRRLRNVIGIYNQLVSNASDAEIKDRAHFGRARVYELQNKLDKALTEYKSVVGDLSPIAEQRAKELESDTVKANCDWLATVDLPKPSQQTSQSSDKKPTFDAALPEASDQQSGELETGLTDMLKTLGDESTPEDRYSAGSEATEAEVPESTEADEAAADAITE